MVQTALKYLAKRHMIFVRIYKKLFSVSGEEYAELIKTHGLFYSMGENCSIIPDTFLGDAKYIRLGNNVRLASCLLLAHDGVVNMLNRAYDAKLDAVGKIDIQDNVFIGHSAIVLRNCTIGRNSVVAAGAVVTGDVPANSVVGGVPAKVICSTHELVERLKSESVSVPWYSVIEKRSSAYDQDLEPELIRLRLRHFFGERLCSPSH